LGTEVIPIQVGKRSPEKKGAAKKLIKGKDSPLLERRGVRACAATAKKLKKAFTPRDQGSESNMKLGGE